MYPSILRVRVINDYQVAYLMADISDVSGSVIKDLYQSLESLSCEWNSCRSVSKVQDAETS